MANLLKGSPVAKNILEQATSKVTTLKEKGINPKLAILRVGENESDLSYQRAAIKRCQQVGVEVEVTALNQDICADEFYQKLSQLNDDESIHGILMFRPLPKQIDTDKACQMIKGNKDIDGYSEASAAGLFTGKNIGFAPCTAEAVIRILDYYGIEISGKKACVIGRSLVIGKPVSMLLLNRNATVTICHSKSENIAQITKQADIVVAASGVMESLTKEYFTANQTVIDVGINYNEVKQKLCGDVDYDNVEPIVGNITPVPGGVGSVTTSILISHVVSAAERTITHED